jgi:hypothetical protein
MCNAIPTACSRIAVGRVGRVREAKDWRLEDRCGKIVLDDVGMCVIYMYNKTVIAFIRSDEVVGFKSSFVFCLHSTGN